MKSKMNRWKNIGVAAAVIGTVSLIGAGVAASAGVIEDPDTGFTHIAIGAETEEAAEEMSVKEVVQECMPAMVCITNTSVEKVQDYFGGRGDLFDEFFGGFFGYGYSPYGYGYPRGGQERESTSLGSGIIVGETDDALLIATNEHVVNGATELSAAFIDEAAAKAEIVGADQDKDIALIKVAKSDLSEETLSAINVIKIGSSEDVVIGEEVVCIGNALGYGQTASRGIISAKDRTLTTYNEKTGQMETNEGLFQTDAAINPGNSGGALLNMKGELIGINEGKNVSTYVDSVGFAIPIDMAEPILSDIANGKAPEEEAAAAENTEEGSEEDGQAMPQETSEIEVGDGDALLGVTVVTISEDYANFYGIPTGVYVSAVDPGTAAEAAGIVEGDIITEVDGTSVASATDLKNLISHYHNGDSAYLTVVRFKLQPGAFGRNGDENSYDTNTVAVTFGTKETEQAA